MKIGMIGAGSIGMLLAAFFAKSGHEVLLVTRTKEQAAELNQQGLWVEYVNQSRVKHAVTSIALTDLDSENFDSLVVAVKSYDVNHVLQTLDEKRIRSTSFLFIQNGMGHIDPVVALESKEVAVAIVEFGARRKTTTEVKQTGDGQLRWASINREAPTISAILSAASSDDFPIIQEEKWLPMLERKLLINLCINPLTAILGVKNGQLIQNDYYFSLLQTVFDEAVLVLTMKTKNEEWERLLQICALTGANHSSMLQDLQYNRPTEIEAICGYIKKRAKTANQQIPTIEFLYNCVKGKEKQLQNEA